MILWCKISLIRIHYTLIKRIFPQTLSVSIWKFSNRINIYAGFTQFFYYPHWRSRTNGSDSSVLMSCIWWCIKMKMVMSEIYLLMSNFNPTLNNIHLYCAYISYWLYWFINTNLFTFRLNQVSKNKSMNCFLSEPSASSMFSMKCSHLLFNKSLSLNIWTLKKKNQGRILR